MNKSIKKIRNVRWGLGRLESNYIATNPKIFEELKIGDMLICVEKDDYFKMQEGILELLEHIVDIYKIITPEMMKNLKIKRQLKEELNKLMESK